MNRRTRLAVALATTLTAAGLVVAASPASAAPTCTTQQLTAFTGGTQTTILTGRAIDADGDHVAFLSDTDPVGGNVDGNAEVFLLKVDTGSITQVTNTTGTSVNSVPSISDDGRLVAFTSTRNLAANLDLNREVVVFNTTTGTFSNLTTSTGGGNTANTSAEISGDGRTVAYLSTRNPLGSNADGNTELFTIRRDTQVRRQVTQSTSGTVGFPSLADDGALLAFPSNRNLTRSNVDGSTELFTFDAATLATTQRTQTTSAGIASQVDVAGTGGQVAFSSTEDLEPAGSLGGNADGSSEVFLLHRRGPIQQLTATNDRDSTAANVAENAARTSFTTEPLPDLGLGRPILRDVGGQSTPLPGPGFAAGLALDDTGTHVLFRSSADLGASGFAGDLFLSTCTAP